MQLSEARRVIEALSANDANHKISEGWTLLAVVSTTHPNGELHPCYVLGKSSNDHDKQSQATNGTLKSGDQ